MAPIRTLVLEADGSTRKAIAADTLLRGVLRLDRRVVPVRWRAHPAVRKLLGPGTTRPATSPTGAMP